MSEKKMLMQSLEIDVAELASATKLLDLVKVVLRGGPPVRVVPRLIELMANNEKVFPRVPVLARLLKNHTATEIRELVVGGMKKVGLLPELYVDHDDIEKDPGEHPEAEKNIADLAARARAEIISQLRGGDGPILEQAFQETHQVTLRIPGQLLQCFVEGHVHARDSMHFITMLACIASIQERLATRRSTEPAPAPGSTPPRSQMN